MHKLISIIALSTSLTLSAFAGGSGIVTVDGQSYTYWQNGPYINVESNAIPSSVLSQIPTQGFDLKKFDDDFKARQKISEFRTNAANRAFAKGVSLESVTNSNWVPRAELAPTFNAWKGGKPSHKRGK